MRPGRQYGRGPGSSRPAMRAAALEDSGMKNVVIAGFKRSPFTLARKGALAKVRPDDMLAQVIAALVIVLN